MNGPIFEITVFDHIGTWKVWSNAKHRVQCIEATIRVSIASFLLGPREAIEPLPELVDDDHPCLYMPTTYEEYIKFRLCTKLQAGEALKQLERSRSKTDEPSPLKN